MPYGTVQADKIQGSFNSFSPDSSFFRNRIINGAMMIDQRNNGASVTIGSGGTYLVDRFYFFTTQASKLSGQRSTIAPSGFVNSTLITVTAAVTPGASDNFIYAQIIEGSNIADFGMGTAGAVTFTVSFWVRSSVTGTFACRVANGGTGGAPNRSYVSTFTINAANTWEYKTITIAGDTSGTWQTGTSGGLEFTIDLGSGSNFNTTANAWQAGNFTRTSGATSLISTNGATFYITGVQIEEGTTATSFDYRPYGTELQLCQRYARLCGAGFVGVATASATNSQASMTFGQTMRASPTVSLVSGASVSFVTGEEVQTASSPGINTVYLQPNGICIRISGFTATGSRGDQRVTQSTTDNWLLVTAEL